MSESNTASLDELRKKRNLTAQQAGGTTVAEFFKANRSAMTSVLPRHIDAERMLKVALHALRTTPRLMECKLDTLMGAIMTCAQLGLEPNTPLGHAYLIPFRNKRKGITEVQVITGYKGLLDLARRSGRVKSIGAHAARKADHFRVALGTDDVIEHTPELDRERGEIVAFYAVAHFMDGGHQFEVMSKRQVDAIRARSKSANDGPWQTDYEQMGRKTVIRRLANYLPLSIEFARANALDGLAAGGETQDLDRVLEGDFSIIDGQLSEGDDDAHTKTEGADDAPHTGPQDGPAADALVAQIQNCPTVADVRAVMARAGEALQGADKAKVTRAGNAAIEALGNNGTTPSPAPAASDAGPSLE